MVDLGAETVAYGYWQVMASGGVINDLVAGVEVAVVVDPANQQRWAVFSRKLDAACGLIGGAGRTAAGCHDRDGLRSGFGLGGRRPAARRSIGPAAGDHDLSRRLRLLLARRQHLRGRELRTRTRALRESSDDSHCVAGGEQERGEICGDVGEGEHIRMQLDTQRVAHEVTSGPDS